MDKKYAEYLLDKTKKDYNLIASDYARTRAYIPDDIKKLGEYANPGNRVLDLGCANGRFWEVLRNKRIDFYGADFSEKLIEMAKKKYPEGKFLVASALSLPFPDDFFDKVYSISVLHHIPSKELRLEFLKEAKRVLKPKGLLVLRVWDFWKRKGIWKLLAKYALLKLIAKSKLDFKDVFISWRDSGRNVLIERYFHCFAKKELEKLFLEAGFKIKKSWREGEKERTNIYLIAEK